MEYVVNKRLREFIETKEISIREFERICSLPNGYVKGVKNSITADKLRNINLQYPDFNYYWVLTGQDIVPKSESAFVQPEVNFKLIPVCSQDVAGGINNKIIDQQGYITGYLPFVNAREEDFAVTVTNDSMTPAFPPGTIIQLRKIVDWKEFIEFGQVHVIELVDDRRLIKRVRKGPKGYLVLESENPKYDPAEIQIELIRNVWLVIAKYRKEVM